MTQTKPRRVAKPQALCIFYNAGRILVYEATDSVKNETFYRPLGGMIEFQERGANAAKRELWKNLEKKQKTSGI
jgi:hypothetical protein